jgi:hypothetical protein
MCTLSYVPLNDFDFVLTSNRDEAIFRKAALEPQTYTHNCIKVTYPKDTQAGGTWLAAADNGFLLCLLNGAFVKHERTPPYKHSRGLVVLDFFKYNNVEDFLTRYDFINIEPFTLVVFDSPAKEITEIRWDGTQTYSTTKDWSKPQIWSSATLYEPEVIEQRKQWFVEFLQQNPKIDLNKMLHFHHFGGNDDVENRFLMNRNNGLKTISITGIKKCESQSFIHHEDLITNKTSVLELAFNR